MRYYFGALFFSAAMIAVFPLFSRGQNGQQRLFKPQLQIGLSETPSQFTARRYLPDLEPDSGIAKNMRSVAEAVERNGIEHQKPEPVVRLVSPTSGQDGQPDKETRIFRVTAYCAGECCCAGSADGFTASGHRITAADYGRICAMPKSYAFGTVIKLEGYGVVECQDRGGAIKARGETVGGKRLQYDRIDILMKDHETAKRFGVKYLNGTILG